MRILLSSGLILLLLIACQRAADPNAKPRYVVLSPEIAELVAAIDGTGHIVGVTEECDTPATLATLPRVGNFGGVSLEKVVALRPTLVLSSSLEQEALAARLAKLGIRTEVFYPRSVSDLLTAIPRLGALLGNPARATMLADSLRTALNAVSPGTERNPRVYVEIYGEPLMSADSTSYVGDLIRLAGGDNIFPRLARDYCVVKAEDILAADPEVIVIAYPGVHKSDIRRRKGWERLSACRNGRILTLDDYDPNLILRAGPRAAQGIQLLRGMFHEAR